MTAVYPRPTGEIEAKVIDGLWVDLSELLVQQWADRFADVRGFELDCSHTLGTNSKLLVDVFTGDGGYAARNALERREKDYENNSDASEQDRAHAQKFADDMRDTKIKMAQVANTVKIRVDAIRFRGKIQNKPANVIQAEIADQIAQGRKACKELADQLRDSAKTIASNSGGSDDSDMSMEKRSGVTATVREETQAKQHVESQIKPASPQSQDMGLDDRDGKPAEREQREESGRRQEAPAATAQTAQPASAPSGAHEQAKSPAGTPQAHAATAGTHLQSAATATPHAQQAGVAAHAEPGRVSGFAPVTGTFSQPSPPPAQRSSGTTAQTSSPAPTTVGRSDQGQRHRDGDEDHDTARADHAGVDNSAATTAMSAAALAPPPTAADHTPWSASDPSRVAPSGHFLGAGGTGGAGVQDGYLLAGTDPDQAIVDEAVARASALAGSLDAARSAWGLPPTGVAVAGFKDEGGHAYYRAFFEEGLNWAPPGVVVPFGVAAGSGGAPAETSGWPEAAADAWAWAGWHVGAWGGRAALVAVAANSPVAEDLAGAIRWVNARNPTDELRREAVVLLAAQGWGGVGASRLEATDPAVSAFLGSLPPAAVVPVAKELAVSCVEDSYAEDAPALLEAVGVLRRSEPFGAELATRVRGVVRQAAWDLGSWRESAATMGLAERAGAVQACFEPFSMLVAGTSVLLAASAVGARSEAHARMALSDLGYERLAVGADLDLVRGLVERAKRLAWKDSGR